jgi:hypothetical protein
MTPVELAAWSRQLEADLTLYLQARYLRHINKSSKVSKLFLQQEEEKGDFRINLFSQDANLSNIVKNNELDVRMLLKKTPTSLQAFMVAIQMIGQVQKLNSGMDTQDHYNPQNLENLVRILTASTNELFYANKNSTLLPILQNQVAALAEKTDILTLIETNHYNDEKGNIHQKIRQDFRTSSRHMLQEVMEFRLRENLPLKPQDLSTWKDTLTEDIRLYLQSRYIETSQAFFTPAKKLDDFGLKLFSADTPLPDILQDKAFAKMMRGAKGAGVAVESIDGKLIETLEHLTAIQEEKRLTDPALLKRLHEQLEEICKTLAKDGSASRLLPLIELASREFAVIANQSSTIPVPKKNPQKIRNQLATRAETIRAEHAPQLKEKADAKKHELSQQAIDQFDQQTKFQFP